MRNTHCSLLNASGQELGFVATWQRGLQKDRREIRTVRNNWRESKKRLVFSICYIDADRRDVAARNREPVMRLLGFVWLNVVRSRVALRNIQGFRPHRTLASRSRAWGLRVVAPRLPMSWSSHRVLLDLSRHYRVVRDELTPTFRTLLSGSGTGRNCAAKWISTGSLNWPRMDQGFVAVEASRQWSPNWLDFKLTLLKRSASYPVLCSLNSSRSLLFV